MHAKLHNSRGFTLSELLITIAIISVLAAIAIPSIVTLQRNMHYVELENAATQIAQAAQNQMTSKKVSGTWVTMFDEEEDYEKQHAQGLSVSNPSEYYYFMAEQAKENGVLPRNSIEDTVWEGDFVIEYNKSTATVYSVFYSDGKTGFFDAADVSTKPAQTYYLAPGASREHTNLVNAMVGYYEGTPTGATAAVALDNPLISVNKEGHLCLENPNVLRTESWAKNSISSLTIVHQEKEGVSFTLDNVQANGTLTYTIKAQGPDGVEISYEAIDPSTNGLTQPDDEKQTFQFNLEKALGLMSGSDNEVLKELAKQFGVGQTIRVDAKVIAGNNTPCVPSTATAYISWPKIVPHISVLVTDPNLYKESDQSPSHITGSYGAPSVTLFAEDSSGSGVVDITEKILGSKDDEEFRDIAETKASLSQENASAAYQAYRGKTLYTSDIDSAMEYLKASAGSYTSAGSTNYQYQIFEVWINDQRIGSLHNNQWEWGASFEGFGNIISFQDDYTNLQIITGKDDTTFATQCTNMGIAANDDDGFEIYVRTTPKVSDVQSYFDANAGGIRGRISYVPTVASRMDDSAGYSSGERKRIEAELGASSTVASWTITSARTSDIDGFPGGYDNGDFVAHMRVYYAGTPAFGQTSVSEYQPQSADYSLNNSALWLYSGRTIKAHSQAMVQYPRVDDGLGDPLQMASIQNSADFLIPYDRDALYCRVITYHNKDNVQIGSRVYVPHSAQNEYSIESRNNISLWTTENVYPSDASPVNVTAGNSITQHNNQLAYGVVDFKQPPDVTAFFMYLEMDSSNNVTGYYGYPKGSSVPISNLPDNNAFSTWGIYVLSDLDKRINNYDLSGGTLASNPVRVYLGGKAYDAYQISSNNPNDLGTYQTFYYHQTRGGSPSELYYFNLSFAAAVTNNQAEANKWGTTESPYQVRHAKQLINYLPGTLTNSSTIRTDMYYMTCHFEQTHAIDMTNAQRLSNNFEYPWQDSRNIFKGSYNGNGYAIKNYAVNTASYKSGNTWTTGGYGGLFPQAENAAFTNIVIEGAKKPNATPIPRQGNCYIGALCGNAENVDFNNCVVKDSTFELTITSQTAADSPSIALLAGRMSGGSMTDCKVADSDFKAVVSDGSNRKDSINAACLIGEARNKAVIENCLTEKSSYILDGPTWSFLNYYVKYLYCGGLIGVTDDCEVSDCTVSKIQDIEIVTSSTRTVSDTYFGAFIGKADKTRVSKGSAIDVNYYFNWFGSSVSNSKWYGRYIGTAGDVTLEGMSYSNIKFIDKVGNAQRSHNPTNDIGATF